MTQPRRSASRRPRSKQSSIASKKTAEQCDGKMGDWYCQIDEDWNCANSHHAKKHQNKTTCHKFVVKGTDKIRPSQCCKWEGGKCTYDDGADVKLQDAGQANATWSKNKCA